jgi:peptidoglycan/xylan/chitin deacetylase (PgdA/CDA1 family)
MFYRIKTPAIIKKAYPSLIWDMPLSLHNKTVYFTFDDGPVSGVTDKVLEILKQFEAKATFFCLGKNVEQNPDLFRLITEEGHAVGNHTYNHLNGFFTGKKEYLLNVEKASGLIKSKMFRPPYGKIKRAQIKALAVNFQIVMWSILSGDFDKNNTPENIYRNVVTNVEDGNIVVFHDSLKAKDRMLEALPLILEELKQRGFNFKRIEL